MSRYKIDIKYNGGNYLGWQIQAKGDTIQGLIEKALLPLNKNERVSVIGAGRTDTGVHALGQTAHFDLNSNLSEAEILNALNARLPNNIQVYNLTKVNNDFHARYSAIKRYYIYQCYSGQNILFENQAWLIDNLDVDKLNEYAKHLIGSHNFISYSKLNKYIDNTVCEIYQSVWTEKENMFTFKICGNRFLHHMVRYLVGTMIAGAQGKFSIQEFLRLLNEPQKDVRIFIAPPQGLILYKVEYEI